MSAERAFLVTGATGAIGSAVVPLLLAEPATRVYMLLRAPSDQALGARVTGLVDFWGDRIDHNELESRLVAVRGDVCQPKLGMSQHDHDALAGVVTNIVHSAGDVKLNQSIEQARVSAVVAAAEVAQFARSCARSRPIPKIEHLSTVGVAGRRPGLIPEEPLDGAFGYHNAYEQAKAEAEAFLRREMDDGLPVTLHRPSMVVGDSRDGRIIRFQVFYHLIRFIAGSRTRGWLPRFGDVRLDLIPADYVAKAVVASSRRADSAGRIFHLCSGPDGATPLAQLGETLRHFLSGRGEAVQAPRYVSRRAMRAIVRGTTLLTAGRTRRALQSLPYFLDYLEEAQSFANEGAKEFFRTDHVLPPSPEQFLTPVLQYWYGRSST